MHIKYQHQNGEVYYQLSPEYVLSAVILKKILDSFRGKNRIMNEILKFQNVFGRVYYHYEYVRSNEKCFLRPNK